MIHPLTKSSWPWTATVAVLLAVGAAPALGGPGNTQSTSMGDVGVGEFESGSADNHAPGSQGLLYAVRPEDFRLVGGPRGTLPADALSDNDVALLAAIRRPATLDEVLDRGVPFQASQLRRLQEMGLLEQTGVKFRGLVPMLLAEEAEAFRDRLDANLPQIVAYLSPFFEEVDRSLRQADNAGALAATATWVLQERAWHHLVQGGTVDLLSTIRAQQREFQARGWWGLLWYIERPRGPVHRLISVSSRGRTLQLCWRAGQWPLEISSERAPMRAVQFLGDIDDDGRRVRHPERFEDLAATGLLRSEGRPAPLLAWEPNREGSPAAVAEAAARAVAGVVAASLPLGELGELAGSEQRGLVAAMAYAELVPELLIALHDVGGFAVLLGVAEEGSLAAGTGGDGSAGSDRPAVRGGDAGAGVGRLALSAAIWQGLPVREPAIRFPW